MNRKHVPPLTALHMLPFLGRRDVFPIRRHTNVHGNGIGRRVLDCRKNEHHVRFVRIVYRMKTNHRTIDVHKGGLGRSNPLHIDEHPVE